MKNLLHIILYKVYADLLTQMEAMYLGILWWFIEPFLYMLTFYVIFAVVLKRSEPDFVLMLLTGLVVWKWFDGGIRHGSMSIINNAGLLLQVYIPKFIFPLISVINSAIKFLIVFSLLLLFIHFYRYPVHETWLALPLLLIVEFVLIYALTALAAVVMPFLPDLKFLIDNGLTLLFFLSGVFFKFDAIPPHLQVYFRLNPMSTVLQSYRQVLLENAYPDWMALAWVVLFSLGCIYAAHYALRKFDRFYPKVLY